MSTPAAQTTGRTSAPFFAEYQHLFTTVEGMFSFDAALLIAAYVQLAADYGVRCDTLEIGVHHGLSAILMASLRGAGSRFVAVDLFEQLQDKNVSHSGSGSKQRFLANMSKMHEDLSFLQLIARPSSSLRPADLGKTFSLCHVDGGHSADETYRDLVLCSRLLLPNGVLVLDDYFNPNYPGVCEGAIRFGRRSQDLVPLAIGFNKVVFQKRSRGIRPRYDLNRAFRSQFPDIPHTNAELWGKPVLHFGAGISAHIDLNCSTPHRLVPRRVVSMKVRLEPASSRVFGRPGEVLMLPVDVDNTSEVTLAFGEHPIGLTYHLLSADGEMLVYDNRRQYFHEPLKPGQRREIRVPVQAPDSTGEYRLEFDVVWEGICWFKDRGSETAEVLLEVV